jgi:uncharacterized protein (DUF1697 family)
MLRGINVGGHNKIKMDALRDLCVALKFQNPQTYVQSGNIIFGTEQSDLALIAKRIQQSIQKRFACCPEVILRTADELRSVVKKSPFAKRQNLDPAKVVVTFLASDPGDQARQNLRKERFAPEELHIVGRELYIYFPTGMGKSKLPLPRIHKLLNTPGTARNWNSVTQILQIAESIEAS